jgi:hypothetical protein
MHSAHDSGGGYHSPFLAVRLSAAHPGFEVLAVDSLGQGQTTVNLLHAGRSDGRWQLTCTEVCAIYRHAPSNGSAPAWRIEFGPRQIRFHTEYASVFPSEPFVLQFDRARSSATFLGRFAAETLAKAPMHASVLNDGLPRAGAEMLLPGLLHLPDHGSFRIQASAPVTVGFFADRKRDGAGYTRLVLPAASLEHPVIDYTWDVIAPHPVDGLPADSIYDGFRRNFLNALQLNPTICMLANSSAGGPSPFALYFQSAVAAHGVELFDGFTTLDLLRQTLERYLDGFVCYGMAGYKKGMPYDFLDTFPSLLMVTADYVLPSGDLDWFVRHYVTIRGWAERMLSHDLDGDGLLEYPLSGNSGSWSREIKCRPANWWDTIGFAHKDAYGNALAYRGLVRMAEMCGRAGQADDARRYSEKAAQLKALYVPTFLNPATGILAGWKSEDGQLHDYWFLFLNSLAIVYDLVEPPLANAIMDRFLAKMDEVGYRHFHLGLPGNLVPVAQCDYVHLELRWGGGEKADNSDGFQKYENGGATACFAGFTVEALYKLGRWADGDRIFAPMLQTFAEGGFQGQGDNAMTKDWRTWDGTCYGYEGLLSDGYMSLLPVLMRIKHPKPMKA